MNPRRTVAPVGPLVSVDDLKVDLQLNSDDFDVRLASWERRAVAYLDGWRGILGRCIQPQTWEVSYDRAGKHCLPFPDIETIEPSAGTASLTFDALGAYVTLSEPATVSVVSQAPEDIQEAIKGIVCLLVSYWFYNPDGSPEDCVAAMALAKPIRWSRI